MFSLRKILDIKFWTKKRIFDKIVNFEVFWATWNEVIFGSGNQRDDQLASNIQWTSFLHILIICASSETIGIQQHLQKIRFIFRYKKKKNCNIFLKKDFFLITVVLVS